MLLVAVLPTEIELRNERVVGLGGFQPRFRL